MSALQRAGTQVYESVQRFHLIIPADTANAVLPTLTRLGGIPIAEEIRGTAYLVEGTIPAAQVRALEQKLPTLTRGEGALDCVLDSYEPVRGTAPDRARSGDNPLNREEYLLAQSKVLG